MTVTNVNYLNELGSESSLR